MLKQFFQNAKQPRGFWGRSMLSKMNAGHTPLSHWALPQLRMARIHFAEHRTAMSWILAAAEGLICCGC